MQGNLQCFSDKPEALTRICAEKFLLDGKYFLLGSDTHSPESIDGRMKGLERVNDLIGFAETFALTRDNAVKLAPELFS